MNNTTASLSEQDPRVVSQARLMARFLSGGAATGDITAAISRASTWANWGPSWTAIAREHEARATAARGRGNLETAASEFHQAAILHHFGWYLCLEDLDAYFRGMQLSADAYDAALGCMRRYTSDKLTFRWQGVEFGGHLRVAAPDSPVVILIPGLDATEVELHGITEALLARGLSTFAFDGPGQGLMRRSTHIEPKYEGPVSAAIDMLEKEGSRRFGLLGVSLGGYYAPRAAAFESRVEATVAVCGPFNFGRVVAERGQAELQARALETGLAGRHGVGTGQAGDLDLTGVAEQITSPLLVVHARDDRVIPGSEGEELARRTPGAELVMYDRADHVCHNIAPTFRADAADWLATRLGYSHNDVTDD
jgi:2,6-dihydroxypseudooxynicotine hydrolase